MEDHAINSSKRPLWKRDVPKRIGRTLNTLVERYICADFVFWIVVAIFTLFGIRVTC